MRKSLLPLICLLIWAGGPLHSMTEPNLARGFSPEGSFQSGQIDHVSLFNGGLSLTIPIGGLRPGRSQPGAGDRLGEAGRVLRGGLPLEAALEVALSSGGSHRITRDASKGMIASPAEVAERSLEPPFCALTAAGARA